VTLVTWANQWQKLARQFLVGRRAFPIVLIIKRLHRKEQWRPKCLIHRVLRWERFAVRSGDRFGNEDQQSRSKEFS